MTPRISRQCWITLSSHISLQEMCDSNCQSEMLKFTFCYTIILSKLWFSYNTHRTSECLKQSAANWSIGRHHKSQILCTLLILPERSPCLCLLQPTHMLSIGHILSTRRIIICRQYCFMHLRITAWVMLVAWLKWNSLAIHLNLYLHIGHKQC